MEVINDPRLDQYASFWRRLAAFIVDILILGLVETIILRPLFTEGDFSFTNVNGVWVWFGSPFKLTASTIVAWLYFSLLESSGRRGTIGKIIMNVYVADMNGKQITFGAASLRYFSKFLSAFIFGVGFLMILFTDKNQGLHDLLAKTLVIKK